jgi:pilus assembly protein CpaE
MTDKSWKPKRLTGGGSESLPKGYLVELSIQTAECKSTLETMLAAIDGIRIKAGKETEVPSLVILELGENPQETFLLIREMSKTAKSTEIFLTSSKLDSAILLEAMRAGTKEFLAQPIQRQDVEDAIGRFKERAAGAGGQKKEEHPRTGQVLAFFGGKGGVGTTSIAVNFAAALQRCPTTPKVVLVDVNQHGGDLPLYLDLQPNHSFRDISADPSRLDLAFLTRVLTKSESGLSVLPSGYDDLSTGRLSPDCVETTLKLLQANFDYVVIDCGHVLDLTTKKALELSTSIFVTSTLIVPVVHRTKRILELLRGSGFPSQKIRLMMNRYVSAEQDVLKETEDILKQQTFWCIPNDYPTVSQAVNSGKPIVEVAPRSPVAKAFMELAGSIENPGIPSTGRGFLSGWLSSLKGRRAEPVASRG